MMPDLPPPHGGRLIDRRLGGATAERLAADLPRLPRIDLDEGSEADLEMIASGAFSPLEGFMGPAAVRSVVDEMRLPDGTLWPIPVVLPVDDATAAALRGKDRAALAVDGTPIGAVEIETVFDRDVEREAEAVYRTRDEKHPGVAAIRSGGRRCVAGRVSLVAPVPHDDFLAQRLTPARTRAAFEERSWRTVVAFQTRNPIHRAHEYLTKVALETADGLLVHPLVGKTKGDDVPADVRMRCYEVLLDRYFPRDRTLLAVMPAKMHYAGPREAILHAIVRQNHGCAFIIIGRDHAGVGTYYGTYDAQRIFDEIPAGSLAIAPLKMDHTFWCRACGGMASSKTCPHADADRVILSGTAVREMLARGERPPVEFSRPEVADVLIEAMRRGGPPRCS
jgi:ATP sulfurylase